MIPSPDWTAAARVVRRLGFGATGAEVDAAVARGIAAHVADALGPGDDPGVAATPPPSFPPVPTTADRTTAQKKARNTEIRAQDQTATTWWLKRMVLAQRPATEKLTFCWHNHFSTSNDKVHDAAAMIAQNEKLRSMGLGTFRPLAYAMLTDAAMLRWLDGGRNVAGSPNENLAREFMELFALGHGNGYTEIDVREGARALTGWRVTADRRPQLIRRRHDAGTKTVLGVTGNLDAASFCDAVLDHPGSAGYVATRWWQQLASATPPSSGTLNRLLDAYGARRDLRALITAIVTDPEFGRGSIVTSPVEWVVGAHRALAPEPTSADLAAMSTTLKDLGQLPFHPPSVGGWPAGRAWLSTAGTQTRWTTAMRLAAHPQVTTIHDAAPADRVDAAAHLLGVGSFTDRTARVLAQHRSDPVTLTAAALNSPEHLAV
ncbi:DUF1800 domain-containing protein [Williamsia serinedens]|uniref:Uncharacterized conserved protein, DUF1800 family n=1 Tax=Williamsia serinedens TaxID=391736 RepID=A0ABT1H5Z7_9NOCA|nr:DUF1800 domain-containing protein [Williamsia serinedens]MCP2162162.1 Uncharacterized conserved protein, DUF1800 family [Williamsia serinedens]